MKTALKTNKHTDIVVTRDLEKHLAFPDVCLLNDGSLLVVYREANNHFDPPSRIMVTRCPNPMESLEFEPPQLVCDTDLDDRDPSVVQLSDGSLLLNYVRYHKETFSEVIDATTGEKKGRFRDAKQPSTPLALVRSFDGGATWGPPQDIQVLNPPGDFGTRIATTAAILKLPSGELLMPIHNARGSFLIRSGDDGATWGDVTPVAVAEAPIFEEPTLTLLHDGRILAFLRADNCGEGYLYQTLSSDEGRTWTEPEKLNLWGLPAHVLQLSDGRIVATYGYRRVPCGVRYCVARAGLSWSVADEYALRNDGHAYGDLGYPSSVELPNGEVLTVYYITEEFGLYPGLTYIAGTKYRPK